jgi:hypothetical protein
MSAKPTPPCVRALDADGSEFWLDRNGLAWRADSSRVPELDGPAIPTDAKHTRTRSPLMIDREQVVKALASECALHVRKDAREGISAVAEALGLRAEFDAACKEVGRG